MTIDTIQSKHTHWAAEKLRLSLGMDGCGCSDCQELYQNIDLSKYGERVFRLGDIITIIAGNDGREKVSKKAITPQSSIDYTTPVDLKLEETIVTTEISPAQPQNSSVTEKIVPFRPPYRRRGETSIFDLTINNEIAGGGSSRAIASRLKSKGIIVSHMKISRLISEKKEHDKKPDN